jgi:acetylornithine deacetylase/succinyl-diaminopimelate desuccinylase-like protein
VRADEGRHRDRDPQLSSTAGPGPGDVLGGCDLVHVQRVGIKGVVLGPGALSQTHQPDARVPAADLARSTVICRDLALTFFSAPAG